MAGVAGAVEREVPQRRELRLDPVLNHDEFEGVSAISALFAAAQAPARPSLAVVRYGLKLSQMIAIRLPGG